MAVNWEGTLYPCSRSPSPSEKPKTNEMIATPHGFPFTRMIAASEIQPLPADMFSENRRTYPSERKAPASPHNTPQIKSDHTRIRAEDTPLESRLAALYPAARTRNPKRVLKIR